MLFLPPTARTPPCWMRQPAYNRGGALIITLGAAFIHNTLLFWVVQVVNTSNILTNIVNAIYDTILYYFLSGELIMSFIKGKLVI